MKGMRFWATCGERTVLEDGDARVDERRKEGDRVGPLGAPRRVLVDAPAAGGLRADGGLRDPRRARGQARGARDVAGALVRDDHVLREARRVGRLHAGEGGARRLELRRDVAGERDSAHARAAAALLLLLLLLLLLELLLLLLLHLLLLLELLLLVELLLVVLLLLLLHGNELLLLLLLLLELLVLRVEARVAAHAAHPPAAHSAHCPDAGRGKARARPDAGRPCAHGSVRRGHAPGVAAVAAHPHPHAAPSSSSSHAAAAHQERLVLHKEHLLLLLLLALLRERKAPVLGLLLLECEEQHLLLAQLLAAGEEAGR
jgi:hypothetical protein